MLLVFPLVISALVIRGATKLIVDHVEERERREREAAVRDARARARREARKAHEALAKERNARARGFDRVSRDPRVDPDVRDRLSDLAQTQRQNPPRSKR